jgi:hypothetical protein
MVRDKVRYPAETASGRGSGPWSPPLALHSLNDQRSWRRRVPGGNGPLERSQPASRSLERPTVVAAAGPAEKTCNKRHKQLAFHGRTTDGRGAGQRRRLSPPMLRSLIRPAEPSSRPRRPGTGRGSVFACRFAPKLHRDRSLVVYRVRRVCRPGCTGNDLAGAGGYDLL